MHGGKYLKKTVLELGGSDPFIVLRDADLEMASQVAVMARLQNCGQSCIAAKRFIVEKSVADVFLKNIIDHYGKIIMGDPMDEKTMMGPLINEASRKEIERQVQTSVKHGARVVFGGKRREGKGFFYEPTILLDVKPGMPAYDEEIFGPVASVMMVDDEVEAVRVANDSRFGLGACIWTKDEEKAEMMAEKLECGAVFINGMVKSDPRLPFGGVKKSGYGRELSRFGLLEFMNIKTVWVR